MICAQHQNPEGRNSCQLLLELTHIRVLQGAHIISAIATHEGHIAQLLQAGDDKFLHDRGILSGGCVPTQRVPSTPASLLPCTHLLFGGHTGKHLYVGDEVKQLLGVGGLQVGQAITCEAQCMLQG